FVDDSSSVQAAKAVATRLRAAGPALELLTMDLLWHWRDQVQIEAARAGLETVRMFRIVFASGSAGQWAVREGRRLLAEGDRGVFTQAPHYIVFHPLSYWPTSRWDIAKYAARNPGTGILLEADLPVRSLWAGASAQPISFVASPVPPRPSDPTFPLVSDAETWRLVSLEPVWPASRCARRRSSGLVGAGRVGPADGARPLALQVVRRADHLERAVLLHADLGPGEVTGGEPRDDVVDGPQGRAAGLGPRRGHRGPGRAVVVVGPDRGDRDAGQGRDLPDRQPAREHRGHARQPVRPRVAADRRRRRGRAAVRHQVTSVCRAAATAAREILTPEQAPVGDGAAQAATTALLAAARRARACRSRTASAVRWRPAATC